MSKLLCALGRFLRGRPRATLVGSALLLALVGAGVVHVHALRQWDNAKLAIEAGRAEEARRALGVCLFLWPGSPSVRLLTARACRLAGRFEEAEGHLAPCLKSAGAPRDAAQLEFYLMRVQLGELDQVEGALLNCVENKHPEAPMILKTLAGAHMRNLRYAAAFNVVNRWIAVDPRSAEAHEHRGWLHDRAHNPKGAIADYGRAVELEPGLVPARLRLSELLLQENDPLRAAPHLEMLYRAHPNRPDVLARLGQCRFLQGDPAEARRLLEAAAPDLPDDPLLLVNLAKLDVQDRKYGDAERRLKHLLARDPADAEGQFTFIGVLRRLGREAEADVTEKRYQETEARLRRVNVLLRDEMERSPTDPSAPHEAGRILLSLGQERLGLHWMNEALKRDPRHRATHAALAEHFERKGDKERSSFHRGHLAPSP